MGDSWIYPIFTISFGNGSDRMHAFIGIARFINICVMIFGCPIVCCETVRDGSVHPSECASEIKTFLLIRFEIGADSTEREINHHHRCLSD